MSPERWLLAQEVLTGALERSPGERTAYLQEACSGDPDLLAEVESLLDALEHTGPADRLDALASSVMAQLEMPVPYERIGPYRVLREIGRGGMGTVYLAERDDAQFSKRVALKVVHSGSGNSEIVRRFLVERQILAELHHPNIAGLLDGGVTEDGNPYFVMEYVEGVSIDVYCDRHCLSIDERLQLFQSVCGAVHSAHQNLVVHRDLKPANILVTEEGAVKLLDFGIAKLLSEDEVASAMLTRTGARWMTPEYAAPEQVRGERITTATDVYALGLLLYELMTGRLPYDVEDASAYEIEHAICDREPERPSMAVTKAATTEVMSRARRTSPERLRRRLSGDLDMIALKALRKEPERRYASAERFLEDVKRHLAGLPVEARPDTLSYRAAKFVRRHRMGVAAAVLLAVSVLAGMAGTVWQAQIAARERDLARLEAAKSAQVASFLADLFKASDPLLSTATERPDTMRVRDLLERGVERVQRDLGGQPAVQANMLNVVGDVYRNLGLYDESLPLLEKALSIRRDLQNAGHPDQAESLSSLAAVLHQKGDYETAEKHFRDALAIQESFTGRQDTVTARTLVGLALVLRDVGRHREAGQLLREALAVQKTQLGDVHLEVSTTLMYLGTVFHAAADLKSAEPYYQEALAIDRKLLGNEHPAVAQSILTTGMLLRERGNLAAAEPLLREGLSIRRNTLGEDHPHTVSALYELAILLREQGDLSQAANLFRQVADLDRRLLGPDHQYVGFDLMEMGVVLSKMRDYSGAERAYTEALSILRGALPSDHPRIAEALMGLGYNFVNKEDPVTGESLLREALRMYEATLGADVWRTGAAKSVLGQALMVQDRYAEAEPLLIHGYETLRKHGGPTHAAIERLAQFYERTDQTEKAAEYRVMLSDVTR